MRSHPPRGFPRPRPTTFRSIAAFCLVALVAEASEPLGEAELVSRFLAGPAVEAELAAWAARADAAATPVVSVANPELEYRHDEARGPAGARTDAIGASVTLDLGLTAGPRRASAEARSGSVLASREAALLEAICSLRRDAGRLWSVEQESTVMQQAQGRLDELAAALSDLAEAGEASGYDRDRAALVAASHRLAVAEASASAAADGRSLERRVGGAVEGLQLAVLPAAGELAPLLQAGRDAHPELVALRRLRDAAERTRIAARRSGAPDLRLSGAARFDAPPEGGAPTPGFEVGVALELPVIDRARADVAEAHAALAETEAALLRHEQDVLGRIETAWRRAVAASEIPALDADPAAVWSAARARYAGGEASIDELLQTARDVEDAQLAGLGVARLGRSARLDLSCAVGRFGDPAIQSAFEEALR